MKLAPITLFVYNRPEHTKRTVEALQRNTLAKESDLFIFSDGAKNEESKKGVAEVRNLIKTVSGFKNVNVIERSENLGLARSIITGVTDIVNKYGSVIVLEDDLLTSPYFLKYMNDALTLYENENRVVSIHGYVYPVKKALPETFFLRGSDCWGWATWKRGWKLFEQDGKKLLKKLEKEKLLREFDFDGTYDFSGMLKRQIQGQNDSWAILWYASTFLAGVLTLYPGTSLIENIGRDGSGTHGGNSNSFKKAVAERQIDIKPIRIEENVRAKKIIIDELRSLKTSLLQRIIRKIIRH